MSKCSDPRCSTCDGSKKNNYPPESDWEYYREMIQDISDFIRWGELIFLVSTLLIGYALWGWKGVIVALIVNQLNHLQGGLMLDINNEYPTLDRKQPCSAGVKDCEICGNGYLHDFNARYNASLKWYQKII